MPLILPSDLPATASLQRERIFTMSESEALRQDIRPIRIAIVNLMPKKEETELQLLRRLSNTALQVHIDLIRTRTYDSKNAKPSHLEKFYKTFEEIKGEKYDAMIVTGAPVEKLDYEEVLYWSELTEILDYARENVFSTMFICWAAQAALYHYYGIPKYAFEEKLFGVYKYPLEDPGLLLKGFDDEFWVPQSRYSFNRAHDLLQHDDLRVWAAREDTGIHLASTADYRLVFSSGHWEYDEGTLQGEYERDLNLGLNTKIPVNYFRKDDPSKGVNVRWRSHGNLFFANWLNYCVYQETPYDIEAISAKKVSKFGGSSLSDATQFMKVKEIIHAEQGREIVVVSAPGKRYKSDIKTTDQLILLDQKKAEGRQLEALRQNLDTLVEVNEQEKQRELLSFEERFHDIARALKLDTEPIQEVLTDLQEAHDSAFLISRGEYLNARMMSEYLGYEFVDATELIFFGYNGELDKKKTYHAIRSRLSSDGKYVIPGFYGTDPEGNIRLFDRGGSDITGSLIASALKSSVYENWTDVDGVMSKDPHLHQDAKTIVEMNYEELLHISSNGAQIYHKEAIAPLMESHVPINIRNTNAPSHAGTIIRNTKNEEK